MQCCSCYSNKYNEIKMCDLEPFSEIWSQMWNSFKKTCTVSLSKGIIDTVCTIIALPCNHVEGHLKVSAVLQHQLDS